MVAGQVVANTWVPMGSKNSETRVCHSLGPNLARAYLSGNKSQSLAKA